MIRAVTLSEDSFHSAPVPSWLLMLRKQMPTARGLSAAGVDNDRMDLLGSHTLPSLSTEQPGNNPEIKEPFRSRPS